MTVPIDAAEARAGVLAMLALRGAETTICPSEVARSVAAQNAGTQWRDAMPLVHEAVDALVADGVVQLSWKGQDLPTRAGPYRIRAARSSSEA